MSRGLVLIPARYQSSRFPGKPLALIAGLSMIERVYQQVLKSGLDCAVVTDDERIEKHVRSFSGQVVRVDDDVPSGTERIALAYQRYFKHKNNYDLIVNFQGDEPLFEGREVLKLYEFHKQSSFDMATMVRERKQSEDDFKNPNVVKAILTTQNQCLYFTRASAPFARDVADVSQCNWWQHVGIYSYKASVLEKFVLLPMAKLENLEKLEQLRALENGMTIGAIATTVASHGVDVPQDIKKVEEVIHGKL
jgi:3-deoxy-manno-octulosonate cytidylyltransferase (CMP-KDO synthetase)